MNASGWDHPRNRESIQCAECGSSSSLYWHGWRAFRPEDPGLGETPALAFYCPSCAMQLFGPPGTRGADDRRHA